MLDSLPQPSSLFPDPSPRQPATHSATAHAPRYRQIFLSTPVTRGPRPSLHQSRSESSTTPPLVHVADPCAADREAADRWCKNESSSSAPSECQTSHEPLSQRARDSSSCTTRWKSRDAQPDRSSLR